MEKRNSQLGHRQPIEQTRCIKGLLRKGKYSAGNVATATSTCSITFLLRYNHYGNVKGKQNNAPNIV